MTRPLIALDTLRQAGMPRIVTEHDDTTERLLETVLGVVVNVYPIDHAKNDMGQMLADVQPLQSLPMLRRVPIGVGFAHGETEIATANTRDRQPYAPKARNQMDGATYDIRPGTRVRVGFIGGNIAAPMIVGIVKFNRQGELAAPVERRGVDAFGTDGHLAMGDTTPLDSRGDEYPRAVDAYNGTARVIDNRGNYTVQTTTDQEPVHPGHNGIPIAPDPEGNVVFSTRGARVGRVGILTGKSPVTGDVSDGTIRLETAGAKLGNLIAKLFSDVGRIYASTRGSKDGRVYVEDAERSYVGLQANGTAELHGAEKVVLDGDAVCLGNANPSYHAVLHEVLNEFVLLFCTIFDAHVHTEVESGDSTSGPPASGIMSQYMALYQSGDAWKSDHVKLVKAEGATPHREGDPDGGAADDDPPSPPPDPPQATEPPKRKKGGAGGGGSLFDPRVPRDKLGRRIRPT